MPRPEPVSPRASAAPAPADTESSLRFSVVNLALLGAGLAAVVAGFMLLAGHSTVAGPLLLVLGFAVLVPLGIIR